MYSNGIIMLTVAVLHMWINYSKEETEYSNEVMDRPFNCILKF